MSREAWGRWGSEDEVGAVNLIGCSERRGAFEQVSEGRVISLAQCLNEATPRSPHRRGLAHFMDRDGGDYAAGARRPGGFQFAEDTVILPTHSGTHIDALCHVWYEDQLYNGFSSDEIRSTSGAARCGVEKIPPIVARGVLIDLWDERTPPGVGDAFGRRALQQACERTGTRLLPGDVVVIRTGWLERASAEGLDYFDGEPGIDEPAAVWLAEQGVSVVGADNYAVECIPSPDGQVFPVHQRLIRDFGIPILEGLVLSELASTGRTQFLFCVAPLPLQGATGSPVHPIAIL